MDGDHVAEKIESFVMEKFPLAQKRGIGHRDHLLDSGIVDSLGVLDLVSFVEQEFGVVVEDEELAPDHFQTIEALSEFVAMKRNGTTAR